MIVSCTQRIDKGSKECRARRERAGRGQGRGLGRMRQGSQSVTAHLIAAFQGSFFGVRIRFLASEGGSLHKYTNQSQSLRILQPEKRTLLRLCVRASEPKDFGKTSGSLIVPAAMMLHSPHGSHGESACNGESASLTWKNFGADDSFDDNEYTYGRSGN
jgi:hypothetical protein